MPPASEWLTPEEAAAILGVSVNRVYVLAREGRIEAVRTFDAGRPRWLLKATSVMAREQERKSHR